MLDGTRLYIAGHGDGETADDLIDRRTGAFLVLATNPSAGRSRSELREGHCSFPAGDYVVFRRIDGRDVLVLRVVHGHRDLDPLP